MFFYKNNTRTRPIRTILSEVANYVYRAGQFSIGEAISRRRKWAGNFSNTEISLFPLFCLQVFKHFSPNKMPIFHQSRLFETTENKLLIVAWLIRNSFRGENELSWQKNKFSKQTEFSCKLLFIASTQFRERIIIACSYKKSMMIDRNILENESEKS